MVNNNFKNFVEKLSILTNADWALISGEEKEFKKGEYFIQNGHLNKKEWNNTEVVFEISSESNKTKIHFTHIGLVPGVECYAACEKG